MSRQGRTTFVLGAGASVHAGYPLINKMGPLLLAWMRKTGVIGPYNCSESAEFLEKRFGDNIEALFNGLKTDIDAQKPGYLQLANFHRPCLVEAMRHWFADIHRKYPAPAYERFAADVLRPGDRIITFNYDVSLDSKLRASGKWNVGDGYGFHVQGLPTRSTVKLIKLHGSINWLTDIHSLIITEKNLMEARPVFGMDDLAALGYVGLSDPCFTKPSPAVLPLILPTNNKQFYFPTTFGPEWQGFWRNRWGSARRALKSSNRIVICGYGMHPIDRRGRDLLLTGNLNANIEVCCGDDSFRIVQELGGAGRKARQTDQTFFQDWVEYARLDHADLVKSANAN